MLEQWQALQLENGDVRGRHGAWMINVCNVASAHFNCDGTTKAPTQITGKALPMKLGLRLYGNMLNAENFRFAKQARVSRCG